MNIRYPNITGLSEKEQLSQVKSFLHQLVDQLNYALPSMGSGSAQTVSVQGEDMSFYELRSMIVQQMQEINVKFEQLADNLGSDFVKNEELAAVSTELKTYIVAGVAEMKTYIDNAVVDLKAYLDQAVEAIEFNCNCNCSGGGSGGSGGTGGMTLSDALLSPGYIVMDSMSLSVELEEQEET